MQNKRGQVAETITWVFATVVIIFLLLVSIFLVSLQFGGGKNVELVKTTDRVADKSIMGFLSTKDNYEDVKKIKKYSKLDSTNKDLIKKILTEMHWVPSSRLGFFEIKDCTKGCSDTIENDIRGGKVASAHLFAPDSFWQKKKMSLGENKYIVFPLN
jgi:hypothetical protein